MNELVDELQEVKEALKFFENKKGQLKEEFLKSNSQEVFDEYKKTLKELISLNMRRYILGDISFECQMNNIEDLIGEGIKQEIKATLDDHFLRG